jgi:hypothetical protein
VKKAQERIARLLSERWEPLHTRTKKMLLACFCLCFGSLCIIAMVSGFRREALSLPMPRQVRLPPRSLESGEPPPQVNGLSPAVEDRIEGFHRYLDSLRVHPETKHEYDSLVRSRPGLIDSLLTIERTYHLRN